MNITEFFKNNFDYFWNKYCLNKKTGYEILGPEECGADTTFLIFWAQNSDDDVRLIIIFYLSCNEFVPIILTSVSGEKLINNNIIKKMPVRLKNIRKRIGNFYFSDQEISNLSKGHNALNSVMSKKVIDLNASSFEKIVSSLICKGGQENKATKAHSVYAIPSGLYGLGKNRKH